MFRSFLKDNRGQGMSEYAIVLIVIAIMAITAVSTFGEKVRAKFENATGRFDTIQVDP